MGALEDNDKVLDPRNTQSFPNSPRSDHGKFIFEKPPKVILEDNVYADARSISIFEEELQNPIQAVYEMETNVVNMTIIIDSAKNIQMQEDQ